MREQKEPPGLLRSWTRRARRRFRQWRGTEPRTRIHIHADAVQRGGWWICPQTLRPGDVAYCIGRDSDLALERILLREYGARTYVFDPAPDTADRAHRAGLGDVVQLYPIRVGSRNQAADTDPGADGVRMIRIADLMEMRGHRRLDLLKVDVPAAPAIVQDLAELGTDIRQLLVRFPHRETPADLRRVEGLVDALYARGYRIFRISADGSRYSFLRTDFESV